MPVYTVGDTMRKASIQHIHLRKAIEEIREMGDEEISDELFERFISELKHSCLITAGDVKGDTINMMTAKTNHGDFGMLFTDMDEFTKAFPDYDRWNGWLKRNGPALIARMRAGEKNNGA